MKSKHLILFLLVFRVTEAYSGGPLRPLAALAGTALRRSLRVQDLCPPASVLLNCARRSGAYPYGGWRVFDGNLGPFAVSGAFTQRRMLSEPALAPRPTLGLPTEKFCPPSSDTAGPKILNQLALDSTSVCDRVIDDDETLGSYMASLMPSFSLGESFKSKQIDEKLQYIFKRTLKTKDWPYDFKSLGLKTIIQSMIIYREGIIMNLEIMDSNNKALTDKFMRTWTVKDGRLRIVNDRLDVPRKSRNAKVRVSDLIARKQRDFIEKYGGSIEVSAQKVGGYAWANQGYDYLGTAQITDVRERFRKFILNKTGVNLSQEELNQFTAPVHFAAFTDGKKYVISGFDFLPLNELQINARSLVGIEGQFPLSVLERITGKSRRMVVDLGKEFMLNQKWRGVQTSQETEASRYAAVYSREGKEAAIRELSDGYRKVIERVTKERSSSDASQIEESQVPEDIDP